MDIQEFVFESLRQIAEGVTAAKAAKPGIGVSFSVNEGQRLPDSPLVAYVGHRQHPIFFVEFDLSVTARDGATAGGKAGLSVAGFFSAGGEKQSSSETTSTNRLRFMVPLAYGEMDQKQS